MGTFIFTCSLLVTSLTATLIVIKGAYPYMSGKCYINTWKVIKITLTEELHNCPLAYSRWKCGSQCIPIPWNSMWTSSWISCLHYVICNATTCLRWEINEWSSRSPLIVPKYTKYKVLSTGWGFSHILPKDRQYVSNLHMWPRVVLYPICI